MGIYDLLSRKNFIAEDEDQPEVFEETSEDEESSEVVYAVGFRETEDTEEMDVFSLFNQYEREDNDFSLEIGMSFDDMQNDTLDMPKPWKDMTADYYGKHGEFDSNDEDRAMCEDMFGFKSQHPDVDLEEHYGWENKLNYDSDGYSDMEW